MTRSVGRAMISDRLKADYAGVFDGRLGFGTQPCVLVVDFIRAYVMPDSPLHAPPVAKAIDETVELLERARETGCPVIYTRVLYSSGGLDGGLFVVKIPALRGLVAGAAIAEIVPAIAPRDRDVVLVKQYASAFFGTALASMLTALGVDTIVLVGCSTSGCVRATAVDGLQHGFRVVIPRECVADRHQQPHQASLFDIDSKYGDVVDKHEVLTYLTERHRS